MTGNEQDDMKRSDQPDRSDPGLSHLVIDRLYEVAVDPLRYEELLDQWESLISPIRRNANGAPIEDRLGSGIGRHFQRAGIFLDQLEYREGDMEKQDLLSPFGKSAAFMIGRDMKFIDVNDAAHSALGISKGAALADLPLDCEDLEALREKLGRMLVSNCDDVAIFRARMCHANRVIVLQLRSLHPKDGPPVVIAATTELKWPERLGETLRAAFGLTKAETDIIRALTECRSLRDIAEARGRSIETVRAQMRSILSKTETRSQTELVRLTLSMMEITSYTEDQAARATPMSEGYDRLAPRPYHRITQADGRIMEYLILGAQEGRPCLYMPLDYGLARWPASAEEQLARSGIRVIVPIRGGYGNSTPLPKKAHLGTTVAQDILHLLDHLGVSRCPAISLGSDIYYLGHMHRIDSRRLSAVVACAGTFPLTRPEQYERMGKWHRFILASARYTPHLMPFMVRAGFSLARRLGKRGFVSAVYGGSPADIETFSDPEVFEAMVCGSEICLSETHSAHDAFAREVREQETTDWSFLLDSFRDTVPVTYMNGTQDPQVPEGNLREFMQEYPWIEFRIYEDCGQLLFFRKWPEVIDRIRPYLG